MRPLRLEFQGIHSYRDPVEVDFSRLVEGGLFGIFGPTGAGKSTILDAITFALYGRIDRTSSLVDSLSSGAEALWAKFRFSLGGEVYEVYRRMERRGSGLASVDFHLKRGEECLPLEGVRQLDQAVEALLGLSFEQFVTAVFLPQGKFARFLRLKPADRRKLLAEIFRLERFGDPFYRAVRESLKELEAEAEGIRRELSSLEGFTPEALEEEERKLQDLEAHREALAGELRAREEGHRLAREYLRLSGEVRELMRRFGELTGREWSPEALGELRRRAELAERAGEIRELARDLNAKREELSRLGAEIEEIRRELHGIKGKRVYVEEEARKRLEVLDRQKEELLRVQGMLAGIEPGRVRGLEGRLAELRAELEGLGPPEGVPCGAEELPAVEGALAEAREILARLGTLSEQAEGLAREISADRGALAELEGRLSAAGRSLEELEATLQAKRGELEELKRSVLAAELARGLVEGAPCPVCGSTEHPSPARTPEGVDPVALEEELGALEDEVRAKREEASALRAEAQALRRGTSAKERRLKGLQGEIRELEGRLRALKEGLPAGIRGLEWREIQESLPRWKGALRRREVEAELGAIKGELSRLQRIWEEALRALGEIYQPLDAELLAEELSRVRGRLRRIEAERATAERNLDTFLKRERELENRLSTLLGREEGLRAAVEEGERRLGELLSRVGITLEEAEALEATEELKDALELGNRIAALVERLSSYPFPGPGAAEETISNHERLRREYEALGQAMGEQRERLRNFRERVARVQELRERLGGTEAKLGLHRELEGLLRGKAFVEFLVGSHFGRILARASQYTAQLSQGRYVLQGEGTELEVVDYRNGGTARPPHTLSGGETFLVSLSLALALSEAIQSGRPGGTPPIEFFFIDEGFGSLDQESVALVLELLHRLVDEGLHVGVITHLEELRRGIPRKLLVHPPNDERGSRVEVLIGE